MCLNCHAVLNQRDLTAAQNGHDFLADQSGSSAEFYAITPELLESVGQEVEKRADLLRFLFEQYPEVPRGTFLDFGAGRGFLCSAAARHFRVVYACELNTVTLEEMHPHLPHKDRINIISDVQAVKGALDTVAMFHVIEHLPDIRAVLTGIVDKLSEGGALFFQIPMQRNEYLVFTHYTFLNEVSARTLCESLGLDVLGVWYDTGLDFLTCIARKPSQAEIAERQGAERKRLAEKKPERKGWWQPIATLLKMDQRSAIKS
ncbi:MAG: class I SAM-dependent methyltransferase [Gemmataceae bacterium]